MAQLHRVESEDEVVALWRRGMATLSSLASEQHPVPLEGFNPAALLSTARIALTRGFIDDLGWLSPPAAAVGVFALASALPRSDEKRELGRRVLQSLHQSDAETFIALATALALGSSRALRGAYVRARVALSLDLPLGVGIRADALALALLSRPDSEQAWLGQPSMGALTSRRLASRLLERAAREAARRYQAGDDTGVRVFEMPSVRTAMDRLLGDRESLVWRHAAAARGLLSNAIPAWGEAIEAGLGPELSPTEWRRAATSLAARIALDPEATLRRCRAVCEGELARADRGVVAAMVHGISCAADSDPASAEALLEVLVREVDYPTAEALADLRRERVGSDFGADAVERVRTWLATSADADALGVALMRELAPSEERERRILHDHLAAALAEFAAGRDARPDTERALEAAHGALVRLERITTGDAAERDASQRRAAFLALRELDRGLLETSTLADLLLLYAAESRPMAERLIERLARWLLAHETRPLSTEALEDVQRHFTWRMHRLRALLHLVDIDVQYGDGQREDLYEWRLRAVNVLLARALGDVPSPLRRALCATLARACDAVVREELCELSDVFVAVTLSLNSETDLTVLAEASMMPSFKRAIHAYVDALDEIERAREDVAEHAGAAGGPGGCLAALHAVVAALPAAASPRVEALRGALAQVARALSGIAAARGLSELSSEAPGSPLGALLIGVTRMARLVVGACRQLGYPANASASALGSALRGLEAEIEHALRGDRANLRSALIDAARTMRAELAPLIADVAALVFEHLDRLPATAPAGAASGEGRTETRGDSPSVPLAPWLPPDRVLGGFYVLRAIDRGAVGSVFVACRVADRQSETPDLFALKVPEYGGDAAHTLSEAEFMALFREEAQALLSMPAHPNLSRFITFDAGARPKPILVMELVEGPTLERMLDREDMSVAELLATLDGVAAGLSAMHRVGIAHLDVKPSNIILRPRGGDVPLGETAESIPVLVDFGLAGRRIRPGCATVYYGAPEVWAQTPQPDLAPMPTDVYAFACMAFEMLTGELLFDGDTAVAIVSEHLRHDGTPARLTRYRQAPHLEELMSLLGQALHPKPAARADIDTIRAGLAALAPALSGHGWPLL
ncbi:serine/threonine-protein kinase [Haliangium ochraceum]|uniref:serine/threonine-protein kinase n=1 Tax=Haliangium ochraceum TaxID=80816 RepID=UPI00126A38FE|nr:serine/threonine-protein kinase [Haliangium ochraceum]